MLNVFLYNESFIKFTFEVHGSLVRPLYEDGLVGGLVALQLGRAGGLVAHKALLALQDKHGTVGKVEVVPETSGKPLYHTARIISRERV